MAGGAVYNPNATADCEFCSVTNTNEYLAAISSKYSTRWRDFGIMWVFVIFNIGGAIFLYRLVRVPKNTRKMKGSTEVPGVKVLSGAKEAAERKAE
jgi:ABC-type multidrug transport system permease subunit